MDRHPRFLADEMLGSLARWLRMAGYDTAYVKDRTDREVLEQARSEERILLTRDIQLAGRAGEKGLLITTPVLEDQMKQVIAAFRLDMAEPMSRCTVCNGPLKVVPPEEVEGKVPERVRRENTEFYVCQDCGQIYWKGSHWDKITKRLADLKGDSDIPSHER